VARRLAREFPDNRELAAFLEKQGNPTATTSRAHE